MYEGFLKVQKTSIDSLYLMPGQRHLRQGVTYVIVITGIQLKPGQGERIILKNNENDDRPQTPQNLRRQD